jgi:hypothetical protein
VPVQRRRKESNQSLWRRFPTRRPSSHLAQLCQEFLSAFAKLRKAMIAFDTTIRLSVRPSALNTSVQRWTYFHEI